MNKKIHVLACNSNFIVFIDLNSFHHYNVLDIFFNPLGVSMLNLESLLMKVNLSLVLVVLAVLFDAPPGG